MEKIKKEFELEYIGNQVDTETIWINNSFKDVKIIKNVYKFKKYKDYTLKYITNYKKYFFQKRINNNTSSCYLCKTEDEMIKFLKQNIKNKGGF